MWRTDTGIENDNINNAGSKINYLLHRLCSPINVSKYITLLNSSKAMTKPWADGPYPLISTPRAKLIVNDFPSVDSYEIHTDLV